jgi:hypothetical protein
VGSGGGGAFLLFVRAKRPLSLLPLLATPLRPATLYARKKLYKNCPPPPPDLVSRAPAHAVETKAAIALAPSSPASQIYRRSY